MMMNCKGGLVMKRINYIMAAIMAAAISSCAEKIEEPTPGASRNDYVAPVESRVQHSHLLLLHQRTTTLRPKLFSTGINLFGIKVML